MLQTLKEIFELNTIEDELGKRIPVHSNTPIDQGFFIQKMFDFVKPKKSLEVGFAYGISALFILEKHKESNSGEKAHIVIEPFPWGNTAKHNIAKEGLLQYVDIRNEFSDVVIPSLYLAKERIQYAYVDTTKLFDVVMQDFYFIDKILDIGGVIIIDDCSTNGINKVCRFINGLPNYKIVGKIGKVQRGVKYNFAEKVFSILIRIIPLRNKIIPNFSFKTDIKLGLDYRCIAFQKTDKDSRNWDWDSPL